MSVVILAYLLHIGNAVRARVPVRVWPPQLVLDIDRQRASSGSLPESWLGPIARELAGHPNSFFVAGVSAGLSAELYRWSVSIHVISAVVWVGGMWFIALVLAPELRKLEAAQRTELYHRVGVRIRAVGWTAIALLILSGLYNLGYRGVSWSRVVSNGFWSSRLGSVLAVKLVAVAAILVFSVLHDFVYGPRLREVPPGTETWRALRSRVTWIGRLNAVLALIVVILGTRLFR